MKNTVLIKKKWAKVKNYANPNIGKNPGVKPVGVGVGRRALGAPEPQSLPDRGAGRRGACCSSFQSLDEFLCVTTTIKLLDLIKSDEDEKLSSSFWIV